MERWLSFCVLFFLYSFSLFKKSRYLPCIYIFRIYTRNPAGYQKLSSGIDTPDMGKVKLNFVSEHFAISSNMKISRTWTFFFVMMGERSFQRCHKKSSLPNMFRYVCIKKSKNLVLPPHFWDTQYKNTFKPFLKCVLDTFF